MTDGAGEVTTTKINNNKTMTDGDVNLSSDSSSDDDTDWQQVPIKRKNSGSPNIFQQKRPHHDDDPGVSNRFSSLAKNNDPDEEVNNVNVQPKPPPIFVPNVGDITKMIHNLTKVIPTSEYNYKSLRDGQVRISIKTVENYRKVVKHLESSGKNFHTFQLKPERAFRAVIKNLHHTTSITDIKAFLLSLGHQVRSVRNVISRVTKRPLPMFFVDLDPNENNKEIFNIRSFENAIINIEEPNKTDDIVQCFRCQEFGHTKSYCRKPFRCVKCGLDHSTSECKKAPTTPPRCVHCLENHTSSYKGCQFYQNLISKRANRTARTNVVNNSSSYERNNPNNLHNFVSYSQAARGAEINENTVLQKIEVMLQKQIELTNTLINMMSMIMSKICN